jgi:hypothetical protein
MTTLPLLLFALSCAHTPDLGPPPAADASPELLTVADSVRVPMSARRDAVAGTWTVLVTVDEEGDVVAARMEGLAREDVAKACIRHWSKSQWRPAYRGGEAVQWNDIRVSCTLKVRG